MDFRVSQFPAILFAAVQFIVPALADTPHSPGDSETPTYNGQANLIPLRVLVRDSEGRAVRDLTKDDFRVFDNGKPRKITAFSVERYHPSTASSVALPERFVLFLFDDLDLDASELSQVREAATRQLGESPDAAVRVAVNSTSGRVSLAFTADRARAIEAIASLKPAVKTQREGCPPVSYSMADRIVNQHDNEALILLADEAVEQCHLAPPNRPAEIADRSTQAPAIDRSFEVNYARTRAEQTIGKYEALAAALVGALESAIRQITVMPGEREIILVSPGFLLPSAGERLSGLIDGATRRRILISALDARGLAGAAGSDVAARTSGQSVDKRLLKYNADAFRQQADVLSELCAGTGGEFFHNNNDLAAGFHQLAGTPEVSYLLAFAPENLQADGKFHKLEVTLPDRNGVSIETRRGYYAPVSTEAPADSELSNPLLSSEEVREIPVLLKARMEGGQLQVAARIDVETIRFQKKDGLNQADLKIWSGLFDSDGNYVTGRQGTMHLEGDDDRLAAARASGVGSQVNLDVKPGDYLLRFVVRGPDSRTFAIRCAVKIPQQADAGAEVPLGCNQQ